MRRYYCHIMESSTKYKRREKKINLKHENLIRSCHKICEELGLSKFSANMSFYFSLFAYPCDMRKIFEKFKAKTALPGSILTNVEAEQIHLINKAIFLINLIENALNRFSKKIFKRLMDIPEISHMIQYFLTEGRHTLQNSPDYLECITLLDIKSKEIKIEQETVKDRVDYYISEPFFVTLKLLKP